MAHKKKSRKKSRRVGAAKLNPNSTMVKLVAVAAGYLLGDTINGAIDKVIPPPAAPAPGTEPKAMDKVMEYLPLAGEVGIGGLLLLSKKKSSLIKTGVGGILLGAGLKRALKKFGVLKGVGGYQSVPVIGNRRMAGYQSVPVIGRGPGQLEGFKVNGYVPTGSRKVMGNVNPEGAVNTMNGFGVGSSSGYMQ